MRSRHCTWYCKNQLPNQHRMKPDDELIWDRKTPYEISCRRSNDFQKEGNDRTGIKDNPTANNPHTGCAGTKHRETHWLIKTASSDQHTVRWSPRSHSDGYHCRRTSHRDWTRGLPWAQLDKATDGDVYRTTYRTDCRTTWPEVYQMTTEKPTDILPKLPTEMATEKSTKSAPKPKKDSLQTKLKPNRISCRMTERFQLQFRNTITLLRSDDGNRQ